MDLMSKLYIAIFAILFSGMFIDPLLSAADKKCRKQWTKVPTRSKKAREAAAKASSAIKERELLSQVENQVAALMQLADKHFPQTRKLEKLLERLVKSVDYQDRSFFDVLPLAFKEQSDFFSNRAKQNVNFQAPLAIVLRNVMVSIGTITNNTFRRQVKLDFIRLAREHNYDFNSIFKFADRLPVGGNVLDTEFRDSAIVIGNELKNASLVVLSIASEPIERAVSYAQQATLDHSEVGTHPDQYIFKYMYLFLQGEITLQEVFIALDTALARLEEGDVKTRAIHNFESLLLDHLGELKRREDFDVLKYWKNFRTSTEQYTPMFASQFNTTFIYAITLSHFLKDEPSFPEADKEFISYMDSLATSQSTLYNNFTFNIYSIYYEEISADARRNIAFSFLEGFIRLYRKSTHGDMASFYLRMLHDYPTERLIMYLHNTQVDWAVRKAALSHLRLNRPTLNVGFDFWTEWFTALLKKTSSSLDDPFFFEAVEFGFSYFTIDSDNFEDFIATERHFQSPHLRTLFFAKLDEVSEELSLAYVMSHIESAIQPSAVVQYFLENRFTELNARINQSSPVVRPTRRDRRNLATSAVSNDSHEAPPSQATESKIEVTNFAARVDAEYLDSNAISDELISQIFNAKDDLSEKDLKAVLRYAHDEKIQALLAKIADSAFERCIPFGKKSTSEIGVELIPYVLTTTMLKKHNFQPAIYHLLGRQQRFASLREIGLAKLLPRTREVEDWKSAHELTAFIDQLSREFPYNRTILSILLNLRESIHTLPVEPILAAYMQHPTRPLKEPEIDFYIFAFDRMGPKLSHYLYSNGNTEELITENQLNTTYGKLPGMSGEFAKIRSNRDTAGRDPIKHFQDKIGMYVATNFFKKRGLMIDVSDPVLRYGFDLLQYSLDMKTKHHIEVKTIQLKQTNPRIYITPYEKLTFGQSLEDGIQHTLFVVELYDNSIHGIRIYDDIRFNRQGDLISNKGLIQEINGFDYHEIKRRLQAAEVFLP
jgi:methylphosphotriester-DNA--protein-cysteine methyltransferase